MIVNSYRQSYLDLTLANHVFIQPLSNFTGCGYALSGWGYLHLIHYVWRQWVVFNTCSVDIAVLTTIVFLNRGIISPRSLGDMTHDYFLFASNATRILLAQIPGSKLFIHGTILVHRTIARIGSRGVLLLMMMVCPLDWVGHRKHTGTTGTVKGVLIEITFKGNKCTARGTSRSSATAATLAKGRRLASMALRRRWIRCVITASDSIAATTTVVVTTSGSSAMY
mmetsp:Transcript_27220/g.59957  ORF Transcript_27220/g.59957 Transcript_27220/m.59957 type:complete len:224 (-) Transcript_27220:698-1369(-)